MPKIRRTVNLDQDLHRRVRAVLDRMPGSPSLSSLVNEYLEGIVPLLEEVVDSYQADGPAAAEDRMMASFGRALLGEVSAKDREEDTET